MSFRKKASEPVKAEPVAVKRAKPLRDLPTPPPPEPVREPQQNFSLGERTGSNRVQFGSRVTQPDNAPNVGPDNALHGRGEHGFVNMEEMRRALALTRNADLLGSIDPVGYPNEAAAEARARMTATDQLRRAEVGQELTFENVARVCNYERGSRYGEASWRIAEPGSTELWGQSRYGVVDIIGGNRIQFPMPDGMEDPLAMFVAYAKSRAEERLLPAAFSRAQSCFPMIRWRKSFGIVIDGYLTFVFIGTMGGPNEHYAYARSTRNGHEWRIVENRNGFEDCLREVLMRITCDALPSLRGLHRRG